MLRPLLQLAAISACLVSVSAHGAHGHEEVVDGDWAVLHSILATPNFTDRRTTRLGT